MFEQFIGKRIAIKFKNIDKKSTWAILQEEDAQFIRIEYEDGRQRIISKEEIKEIIEIR